MKSLEAAIILPLIIILCCLTFVGILIRYIQCDRYNSVYLTAADKQRQEEKMLSYSSKIIALPGLKAKNLAERHPKCVIVDCRGNYVVDFIFWLKDETAEVKKFLKAGT